MGTDRFDHLTKALAGGASRRRVLQGLGGALAAAGLAATGRGAEAATGGPLGNSPCAHWCYSVFGNSSLTGQCTSAAAQGGGACFACGPAAPAGNGLTLCGQSCVNESTDPNNCGACGNVCSGGQCTNGSCSPCPLYTSPTPECFRQDCTDFGSACCWVPVVGGDEVGCKAVDACAPCGGHFSLDCYKWAYSSDTVILPDTTKGWCSS